MAEWLDAPDGAGYWWVCRPGDGRHDFGPEPAYVMREAGELVLKMMGSLATERVAHAWRLKWLRMERPAPPG